MDQSHQSLRTVILHACRGFSERLIATPHDQVIIAINGGSSHGLAWLVGVRVTSVLAAATGAEKATWVLVFWVCVFAFYFYLACRSFSFLFSFPFPFFSTPYFFCSSLFLYFPLCSFVFLCSVSLLSCRGICTGPRMNHALIQTTTTTTTTNTTSDQITI